MKISFYPTIAFFILLTFSSHAKNKVSSNRIIELERVADPIYDSLFETLNDSIAEANGTEILLAYNLDFAAEDTFNAEVYGLQACVDHDQIKVMGSVQLNNATLNLIGGFENTTSDEIILIDNDGEDPIVGTFLDLEEEAVIQFGTFAGIISYTGGDGNDVVLKAALEDTEPPIIICSEPMVLIADEGECAALYHVPPAEATDNISSAENITIVIVSRVPEYRELEYPVGETIITYMAIDEAGNESEFCEQLIIVQDADQPELKCPANINVVSIDGSPININDIGMATATDNCTESLNIKRLVAGTGAEVPEFFPVGTTVIQWSTVDDAGNVAFCNQSITVTYTPSSENTITAFTLPNQINQTAINGTSIEILMPIGSDVTNLAPSSLVFSPNATISPAVSKAQDFSVPVSYIVTAEDSSTRTFTVNVSIEEDTIDPTITCTDAIVVNNVPGDCETVVNYPIPVGTDDQPGAVTSLIAGLESGSFFPLGESTITYEVEDAFGNTAQCSFTVTVIDDEAPEINCPASISIRSSSAVTLQIEQPIVTDNCSTDPTITYQRSDHPNLTLDDEFQMGTTEITWTVTDASDNQNSCIQSIEITRELFTKNDINAVEIPNQIGASTINQMDKTITITVPFGTDLTALTPSIEVSEAASIQPESGLPNDFTNPAEYAVQAEDGTVQIWTISVEEIVCDSFQLSLEDVQNPSTCFGTDGSVQIAATGGILPITYSWAHDGTLSSNELTDLSTGFYTLTATDAANCTTELTIELTDPELPEVSLTPLSTIKENTSSFTLSGGLPLGGVYTGQGVTNGIFDPTIGVGSYDITYTYTDPITNCQNSAAQTIRVEENLILTAAANLIDATYLHGASNLEPLGPILRVEQGRREIYLKFDLSSFGNDISAVELQMFVASDPGFGTLEVFLGSHSNWTETSLTGSNKPVKLGAALASISGTHALGQLKTWTLDVSQLSGGGAITLIVSHSNGNDVAFASDETPQAPQLTITASSDEGPIDFDDDGYTNDVDCHDNNPTINPGATEVCDGVDNNCDGLIDDADPLVNCTVLVDADDDGFTENVDCDDNNPLVNPGATEVCDGIDNNCDGLIDNPAPLVNCTVLADADDDGFTEDVDCDDNNPAINPGATEICDGIDNNCDGLIDDADPLVNCNVLMDADDDGYTEDVDCDDNNPAINPGATEICDGIDNNCDGLIDDADPSVSCGVIETAVDLVDATYLQGASNLEPLGPILRAEQGRRVVYMKFDVSTVTGTISDAELQLQVASDPGFGTLEIFLGNHAEWTETTLNFSNRPIAVGTPLATISGTHSLGQIKTWNLDASRISEGEFITLILVHSNGNDVAFASDETPQAPKLTLTTEGITKAIDFDNDGYTNDLDCDDNNRAINPGATEICDGFDNNCDGLIDEADPQVNCTVLMDNDNDGFTEDVDCDDNNPAINPGATEICDGIDNNCDGLIDDADPLVNCTILVDTDDDGYTDDVDCDDNNPAINPGATEICDGIDNNCDGLIDDADPSVSCGVIETEVDLVDATYLQGASNLEPLGPILRAEQGRRVVYMKFDLSSINGTISEAELLLQVASDPGFGTLDIFLGNHADWTETTLNFTNRPITVGASMASISGTHSLGQIKTWNLDASRLPNSGFITLILTHSNGNDVAFASDETPQAPKLTITTEEVVNTTPTTFLKRETSLLPLSPNPAVLETTIKPVKPTELSMIHVYDEIGRLVKTYRGPAIESNGNYTLDVRELAEGVYYIRSIDVQGNEHYEMMMVRK